MKNNVKKIKLGAFVIMGFVTLAGFSTVFGFTATINNWTDHHIGGVIHYVGGRADDTFSIASKNSYGVERLGYLLKEIDVTVYPNWNESTSNVLANVFSLNGRQQTQASLNNVAGGINISWIASKASPALVMSDIATGVAIGTASPLVIVGGTFIGAALGATLAFVSANDTSHNCTWDVIGPVNCPWGALCPGGAGNYYYVVMDRGNRSVEKAMNKAELQ